MTAPAHAEPARAGPRARSPTHVESPGAGPRSPTHVESPGAGARSRSPERSAPLRAGLWVTGSADRPLFKRVRGQTGDLGVALVPVASAPIERSFAAQLEAARALASERKLRVLIWAVRGAEALQLVVADFALDRVLVRPLTSALALSAQDEAAALIARSALRASLAGDALGRPTAELARNPPEPERAQLASGARTERDPLADAARRAPPEATAEPLADAVPRADEPADAARRGNRKLDPLADADRRAEPDAARPSNQEGDRRADADRTQLDEPARDGRPAQDAEAAGGSERADPAQRGPRDEQAAEPRGAERVSWRAGLEVGVLSGIDGVSARGQHALFARASLRWRRVELGLLGGYGLPVKADQALASVRLATHRIEGSAGLAFARGAWLVAPSLALGMHVLRLRADARDARFSAEDDRSLALALGAFVRVAYQPGRIGLSLRLGLDLLPDPTALGYRDDQGFVRSERLWLAQPHAALALAF